ncbi:hypothetical protein A7982_13317 [Minicystis rosea]|nr:hypothetical protein A7982_13317 [Minicystis rosea]
MPAHDGMGTSCTVNEVKASCDDLLGTKGSFTKESPAEGILHCKGAGFTRLQMVYDATHHSVSDKTHLDETFAKGGSASYATPSLK